MTVCREPGCPRLAPCPVHGRKKTGPRGRSNRDMAAHMRFARAVKNRDGYRCRRCGTQYGRLTAHHVKQLHEGGSDHPSNGITLCDDCHKKVDRYAT